MEFDFIVNGWRYNGLWVKELPNGLTATVEYNGFSGDYFYCEWRDGELIQKNIVAAKAFSSKEDLAKFLNDKG
jgi:hypothetical protein